LFYVIWTVFNFGVKICQNKRSDPITTIIFGRLYYHLQNKYGYTKEDGGKVPFFTMQAGSDEYCVNFPYLSSILATLRLESRRYAVTTWLAVIALVVSSIALGISWNKQEPIKQVQQPRSGQPQVLQGQQTIGGKTAEGPRNHGIQRIAEKAGSR
jgi:hypothetical protein